MGFRGVVMGLLVLGASACYRPPTDSSARGSWVYDVEAPSPGSRVVTVEATFDGAHTERLGLPRESVPWVKDIQIVSRDRASARSVERRDGGWFERSCNWRCTVRYSIDLGELANACGDEVDCARRVGDATLSPALAWLVHPVPRTDVPVTVRVRMRDATQFATGMHAADDSNTTFTFRSFDLDEGSFTAFGPIRHHRVQVPSSGAGARIDVAILGNARYAMPDDTMTSWIEEAAHLTVPLFGRFPVDRTTLFVVPAKGEDEVVFGKVLSLAGASVVLVVGDQLDGAARHKDWVLVHELFHLGFPTFRGEGRWLGEGLATYYEPILRARAGWTTEAEVFRQFLRNMPRGLPQRGSNAGLSARDDLDAIYWGGALFCLAADVRIREQTHGRKSLDDVLRAALSRGGDATRVWTVRDVVSLADATTGTTVLSEMYERHAARGERIDFDNLMASLGVTPDGRDVDDSRPLSWIRRRIVGVPKDAGLAFGPIH